MPVSLRTCLQVFSLEVVIHALGVQGQTDTEKETQRNKDRGEIYLHKYLYIKELTHTIQGAVKSEISRAGHEARNSAGVNSVTLRQNSFFPGNLSFC